MLCCPECIILTRGVGKGSGEGERGEGRQGEEAWLREGMRVRGRREKEGANLRGNGEEGRTGDEMVEGKW